jgi:fucose permease
MPSQKPASLRNELAVLHPAFALTGILHAAGGPLLPSLAAGLHLSDSQSGVLFLLYFAGTSIGALLCIRSYAKITAAGFLLAAAASCAVAFAPATFIWPLFLLFGIGVGVPMSAISMIAGRRFGNRSAAPLTLLNFSWSLGALAAPLLVAALLLRHTYSLAYVAFAVAAAIAAVACLVLLQDGHSSCNPVRPASRPAVLRWIMLIAALTFLEVGVENTSVTWLATYALRTSAAGSAHAAASSSIYWIGFMASRALASWVLTRIAPLRILTCAVLAGILGSAALILHPGAVGRGVGMAVLGAALAPIFPLLLAQFFARVSNTSQARWVLACCGFGGSVLPWITGLISSRTGSLQAGLLVIPAALLLVLCAIPALRGRNLSEA